MNTRIGTVVLAATVWLTAFPGLAAAAETRLNLGGQFCEFYADEIAESLMGVAGVRAVDAVDKRKWVVVEHEGTAPDQLVAAIERLKGDGWHCRAEVAGRG